MRRRDTGICVRATDFSETSQVVQFFTRACGTVKLLAKGSKRPKSATGGALDLLSEGDLVFSVSSREALGTLMEFGETAVHAAIRREGRRLDVALYMLELIGDLLPEADPHPEVFDLLHNALARLKEPDALPSAVLAYFQWRLLIRAGLLGELTRCVQCGQSVAGSRGTWFSSTLGGLICARCRPAASADNYRLTSAALEGLQALAAARPGKRAAMSDRVAHAANLLLAYHVQHQLGKPLKMARHALAPNPSARR